MRYLPDLTEDELKAVHDFMKGKKYITEVEIDEFMRVQHKKFGLFEMCEARITKSDLIIKRPIGWNNED